MASEARLRATTEEIMLDVKPELKIEDQSPQSSQFGLRMLYEV